MCTKKVEEYNVECIDCGQVWQPSKGSKAWWYAKQEVEKHPNRLSAPVVTAKICGCRYEEPKENPDAPYRVLGYNDLCEDFDHGFNKFTDAVRLYREYERRGMYTVFTRGISDRVEMAIRLGFDHQKEMDEMRREYQAEIMADEDNQREFDRGMEEFFDRAFAKVEAGEMPVDKLREFFPQTR